MDQSQHCHRPVPAPPRASPSITMTLAPTGCPRETKGGGGKIQPGQGAGYAARDSQASHQPCPARGSRSSRHPHPSFLGPRWVLVLAQGFPTARAKIAGSGEQAHRPPGPGLSSESGSGGACAAERATNTNTRGLGDYL